MLAVHKVDGRKYAQNVDRKTAGAVVIYKEISIAAPTVSDGQTKDALIDYKQSSSI